jgi:hypothetical protein
MLFVLAFILYSPTASSVLKHTPVSLQKSKTAYRVDVKQNEEREIDRERERDTCVVMGYLF